MELKNKIEVCVGIGLDQLTPEYVVIEIPNSKEEVAPKKVKDSSEVSDVAPKKRGRKPKTNE